MPKMSYVTIEPAGKSGPITKGNRDDGSLNEIFSTGPIRKKKVNDPSGKEIDFTAASLKEWFFANVVNGTVPDSGGYYGFAVPYSLDFAGQNTTDSPPDYKKLKFSGQAGEPATAFVPDPSSPGEGSGADPSAKPGSGRFIIEQNAKEPSTPGSGDSVTKDSRNPAISSVLMKTNLPLTPGKSPASSAKNS